MRYTEIIKAQNLQEATRLHCQLCGDDLGKNSENSSIAYCMRCSGYTENPTSASTEPMPGSSQHEIEDTSNVAKYYHLYEVKYISREGKRRTSHVILVSDSDTVPVETAVSEYYANASARGESPSKMVGGHLVTTSDSAEEMATFCDSHSIFARTYSV